MVCLLSGCLCELYFFCSIKAHPGVFYSLEHKAGDTLDKHTHTLMLINLHVSLYLGGTQKETGTQTPDTQGGVRNQTPNLRVVRIIH